MAERLTLTQLRAAIQKYVPRGDSISAQTLSNWIAVLDGSSSPLSKAQLESESNGIAQSSVERYLKILVDGKVFVRAGHGNYELAPGIWTRWDTSSPSIRLDFEAATKLEPEIKELISDALRSIHSMIYMSEPYYYSNTGAAPVEEWAVRDAWVVATMFSRTSREELLKNLLTMYWEILDRYQFLAMLPFFLVFCNKLELVRELAGVFNEKQSSLGQFPDASNWLDSKFKELERSPHNENMEFVERTVKEAFKLSEN